MFHVQNQGGKGLNSCDALFAPYTSHVSAMYLIQWCQVAISLTKEDQFY